MLTFIQVQCQMWVCSSMSSNSRPAWYRTPSEMWCFHGKVEEYKKAQKLSISLTAFAQKWHPFASVHNTLTKTNLTTKGHRDVLRRIFFPWSAIREEWRFTNKKIYLKDILDIVCFFFNFWIFIRINYIKII